MKAFDRIAGAVAALAIFAGLFGVQPVESYTYGEWHTKYVTASSKECAEVKEIRRRYKLKYPTAYVTPLGICATRRSCM